MCEFCKIKIIYILFFRYNNIKHKLDCIINERDDLIKDKVIIYTFIYQINV